MILKIGVLATGTHGPALPKIGHVGRSPIEAPEGDDMLTRQLVRSVWKRSPARRANFAAFLMQGLELANQETTTPLWFALRLGPTTFAIFDAFGTRRGGRRI